MFLAIEQANPGCVVIWKTCDINMPNTEIFQRLFWSFKPSIEGFKHCRPVMSIDGTHFYGKYKVGVSIRLNGSVSVFLFGFLFNRLYAEGNRTEPIFFRFFDLKTEI